jgi:hypothetical protein
MNYRKFHFHKESPKADYIEDLNELIVHHTKDPMDKLTKPNRICRGDVYRLIWAIEAAQKNEQLLVSALRQMVKVYREGQTNPNDEPQVVANAIHVLRYAGA